MLRLASVFGCVLALSIAGAAIGCGGKVFVDPPGSGGGGSGGAGGSASCTVDSDCPNPGQCVIGACVQGACTEQPATDGDPCDDGLFCTSNDYCSAGTCSGGAPTACPPGQCTVGVCDEATQACIEATAPDGTACSGGACYADGVCQDGGCLLGPAIDCSALDSTCAVGVCDPMQGCVPKGVNQGASCDDGLFCTVSDHCDQGQCVGGASMCPQPDACSISTCDEAGKKCVVSPAAEGSVCDDKNPCTITSVCSNGQCQATSLEPDGKACDDENLCTTGDSCSMGVCKGVGPVLFFHDDFHDKSKGWTLGMEWQIGPTSSSGGMFGADPAQDHTPSADNGVAGVVLGGFPSTNVHGFYYLESPAFDTTGGPGGVVLQFHRWLNSDSQPWMHNVVEVWNGSAWIQIWASDFQFIQDNVWTLQQFNLTPYIGPATKVRFGFDVSIQGAFQVGGWNIDDVIIASSPCP